MKLLQLASGEHLTDRIPLNWDALIAPEQGQFIEENVLQRNECRTVVDVWDDIAVTHHTLQTAYLLGR